MTIQPGIRLLCGVVVLLIGLLVLLGVVTDMKVGVGLGLLVAGIGISVQ